MSPPERPPPIRLPMAGGRPFPGNLRPGTPTAGWEEFVALAAAPEDAAGGVAGGSATTTTRAFDVAVGSAAVPGTVAPQTTPVVSEDGAWGGDREVPPRAPAAAAASAPASSPAAADVVAPGGGGSRSIAGAGLYGRAFVVGQGHLHFETTSRMEDWLGRLQALSLERQEEKESVPAAVGGAGTALNTRESARVGGKRSLPTDDDDQEADYDQPATKRSRVGAVFQRTFTRMGRHRTDTTARVVGNDNTITTPTTTATTTSSSAAGPALPTSAFTFAAGSITPTSAAPTVALTASNIAAATATATSAEPSPSSRSFSPFGGFLSRAGSATAASAGAPSSVVASRTIKTCLVGDVAAGKTAFLHRLVDNFFVSTSPTLAPDLKTVKVRADDDSVVNVELWDFPGIVAGERPGPLLSTFFHAAVICFSLEDKANLANIAEVWKPKLDASLHDQHIFVLGLKRDLRPSHPTLGLSFLPTAEPVETEMGQEAARAIHASGYGECSAVTNDNVEAAFLGIVNHVVDSLEQHERTIGRGRRMQRARSAVTEFLNRHGLRRLGRR